MDRRITYADHEVRCMEHLLQKWINKLKEYPRVGPEEWKAMEEIGYSIPVPGQHDNEKWAWEALQMLSEQTDELLELGRKRREGLPYDIPSHFVLVRQPVPYGKTLTDAMPPRELNVPLVTNSYPHRAPMGEGPMPRYATWPYYEPYCHPVRHVRAFGYGTPYFRDGLFALITPDYDSKMHVSRHYPATFALCYDWIAPVRWHVDLRQYEISDGPYSGSNGFDQKMQVTCLRNCSSYGRLIQRGKVVKTHVPVEYAMHLTPPYAVELPRKKKKKRGED